MRQRTVDQLMSLARIDPSRVPDLVGRQPRLAELERRESHKLNGNP